MSQQESSAERPTVLPLPAVPTITSDSDGDADDDSSPSKHIASLVRRHESAKQAERQAASTHTETSEASSAEQADVGGDGAMAQVVSPEESTLSGQDVSLYNEPSLDNADARSTDTEASVLDGGESPGEAADEVDFGRMPGPKPLPLVDSVQEQAEAVAKASDVNDAAPSVEVQLTEAEKRDRKIRNIVQEVVDTERVYVSKLELIHNGFYEEFRERNKREQTAGNRPLVSDETLQKVFRNVREIWHFHAEALYPALCKCISTPDVQPTERVGAVLKKFAPFFKMYTEYTTNYDADMRLLNAETKRNERFAQLLTEIQRRPQCGMLTLQQHMLEPIQRIPRYELLLSTYLKYLPADDVDRTDSESALKLVREAVQKGEMKMKGSEEFKRILELSDIFSKDIPELIQPTRSLVKEGKATKVSARNENERSDRYLFLFSDMLLICTQIPFSSSEAYKLHGAPLKTEGMDVRLVSEADVPGFTALPNVPPLQRIALKTTQKQIEFAVDDDEDRADWLAAFQNAARCRTSLASKEDSRTSLHPGAPSELPFVPGREAPKWIRDSEATMCMICASVFTAVMNRRHHCRSCGHLICSSCSQYRIPLLYTGDLTKLQRVCRQCYELDRAIRTRSMAGRAVPQGSGGRKSRAGLPNQSPSGATVAMHNLSIASTDDSFQSSVGDDDMQRQSVERTPSEISTVSQQSLRARRPSNEPLPTSPSPRPSNVGSVYTSPLGNASQVSGTLSPAAPGRDAARDPALLKAYALISGDHGRSWERRFLAVRDDFAIYIYKAHADIHTGEVIPLPGYKVNKMKEKERVNAFKLSHPSGHVKSWQVQLNDPSLYVMWFEALEHLVCARLPPNAAALS